MSHHEHWNVSLLYKQFKTRGHHCNQDLLSITDNCHAILKLKPFSFFSGTAKKYHEHLRRTALGKIRDQIKLKNKKNLRKERVSIQLICIKIT